MASIKAFQDKVHKVNSLLDPDKAPDSLSSSDCSELGLLSMQLGAVVRDLQKSEQKGKHIKKAIKSVDKIEKDANKILKKGGGGKFKYVLIAIVLVVLYVLFK